jgi:hypothetical protein
MDPKPGWLVDYEREYPRGTVAKYVKLPPPNIDIVFDRLIEVVQRQQEAIDKQQEHADRLGKQIEQLNDRLKKLEPAGRQT